MTRRTKKTFVNELESTYWDTFNEFLYKLNRHPTEGLRGLAMRLNYNRYYDLS